MISAVSDVHERKWYALYTKPRQEFKAAVKLETSGVEYYLPTVKRTRQWQDRKKQILEPILGGYIFIRSDEKERLLAMQNSSIVRTVCFQGKPAVIPDWEIENLKKFLSHSAEVLVSNKIEVGTKVKIIEGPFHDVIGVITGEQENKWLAVSVELLKRSVMVRLPKESIIKVIEK
jgi:transcriptional antiterminator RfaH